MLIILTVLALCSGIESAQVILPNNPMICGSSSKAAHTYNMTHEYTCSKRNNSNSNHTVPQDMNLKVYQRNVVE